MPEEKATAFTAIQWTGKNKEELETTFPQETFILRMGGLVLERTNSYNILYTTNQWVVKTPTGNFLSYYDKEFKETFLKVEQSNTDNYYEIKWDK